MKWRHWAILIVLLLLNYIIFSTAFTQLASQRQPGPRGTRTPAPTFERIEPTPLAWIVAPTSTPRPTNTPVTPTPTRTFSPTAEITATAQVTVTTPMASSTVTAESTETPAPTRTPTATPPPTLTPSGETVTHTIKRGETLSEIAAQYGVTVQAIVEANGIENPSLIVTGQKLTIPIDGQPTATPISGTQATNTPKPTP